MAELIGSAEIRVGMPTADAARSLRTFTDSANKRLKKFVRELNAAATGLASVETRAKSAGAELRTTGTRAVQAGLKLAVLGTRARSAETGLTDVKEAAQNAAAAIRDVRAAATPGIKAKVTLDDDTAAGVAAVTAALAGLQAEAADIRVGINDDTATGAASITAALAALHAAAADIRVSINDDTAAGIAAIAAAVAGLTATAAEITVGLKDKATAKLDALSSRLATFRTAAGRIDVEVRFTGDAGEITASATAVRSLKTAASSAATALGRVTTNGTAAAAALDLVAAAGRDAARALHDLRGRADAASAALGDLRTTAARAAASVRRLGDRSETAENQVGLLGIRATVAAGRVDDFGDSVDRTNAGLRQMRGNLPGLTGSLRSASDAAGNGSSGRGAGLAAALGTVAALSGAAAAALGTAAPAAAGIAAALAAVAPAAGAAATGMLAAVTAGAVLKIGVQGLDEAFKTAFDPEKTEEFNKAMKNLAPSARSFVTAVKDAAPAFKDLRLDVQDRLFQGLGKSVQSTGRVLLPTLKKRLAETAGSLNAMGRGILDTARDLGKSGALDTALKGANQGLKDFEALPRTIVQGLVQVGAAAAPAFQRMTGGARRGIDRLSRSIADVFESGRMEKAISRAASLAKDLGSALGNVGRTIGNVLGAADASGSGLIQNFKTITGELAKVTAGAGVQSGLKTLFETMGTVGRTSAALLGEAVKGIAPVITALGPHVQNLVRSLGSGLTPVVRSLSPVLTAAADNLGRIVSAASPLITVAGSLLSGALDGLAPILSGIGEQAALLAESASSLLGPALRELPGLVSPVLELLGRFGSVAVELQNKVLTALQPALERLGEAGSRLVAAVSPLAGLFSDFLVAGLDGFVRAADPAIRLGGKLAEILAGKLSGAIESVAKWVDSNRLDFMRIFNRGKLAMIDFAITVVDNGPLMFSVFRTLAEVALQAFAGIANGTAVLLGWVPGIGDQVKQAASDFNKFHKEAKRGLDKAADEVGKFSRNAGPKLRQNRLEMQIDSWTDQIKEAKRQLADKNLPREKKARLIADIQAWQRNIDTAKKSIGGVKGISRKITVTSNAKGIAGSAQGAIKSVKDGKPKITVSSNAGDAAGRARSALGSVRDRRPRISVTSNAPRIAGSARSAIASIPNYTQKRVHVLFTSSGRNSVGAAVRAAGATGGLYAGHAFTKRGYRAGGPVTGPGTETSDSIWAGPWLSKNEFVVRAAAVRKYGLPLFQALNSLRAPMMAAGGRVGDAMSSAASGLAGSGRDAGAGMATGVSAATPQVTAAARELAAAAVRATETELQISSPSRRFAAVAKQVGAGFVKGLTGSRARIEQIAKSMAAAVTKAFKGTGSRTDDRLVAMLNTSNKKLQSLAAQRDAIAKRFSEAKKFAADVSSKARSGGSLASLVSDQYYAPRLITGDMTKALKDVKAFTRALTVLKSKGLNKNLLRQILDMGPEAGLAYAKALAQQDKGAIKKLNQVQTQLARESDKLGRFGADALYDSGKKASEGFLAGLKSQQKKLEQLMVAIARAMQKSIRKALGIRSPSTVMEAEGQKTGQGLEVGFLKRLPHIDRAARRVSDTIANGVGPVSAAQSLPARNRQAAQGSTVHINRLVVENRGIIASQSEMDMWLARSLERLAKQRRLPAVTSTGRRAA